MPRTESDYNDHYKPKKVNITFRYGWPVALNIPGVGEIASNDIDTWNANKLKDVIESSDAGKALKDKYGIDLAMDTKEVTVSGWLQSDTYDHDFWVDCPKIWESHQNRMTEEQQGRYYHLDRAGWVKVVIKTHVIEEQLRKEKPAKAV